MRLPLMNRYRGKHNASRGAGAGMSGPQARRTLTAWRTVVVLATAAVVTALLGAVPLQHSADLMQPSMYRTAALAVTGAMAKASSAIGADRPWRQMVDGGDGADGGAGGHPAPTATSDTTLASLPPATTTSTTAAAGGATSTSSTTTTERVTTTTTLPLFTADKPLRVLVVGDSLMNPIGYALMRQADVYTALQVKSITKASSGLVRPDFYDWPQVIAQTIAEYHPHVTVMLFGGNEKQVMRYQGKSLQPFSDEWNAEYAKRVDQAIEISAKAGASVIWVGLPIMRSSKFSETARTLNAFYSAACAEWPAAAYIDGYALFSESDGRYSAYLKNSAGENQLMRSGDGIHFTDRGGDRVAGEIVRVLLTKYRLE